MYIRGITPEFDIIEELANLVPLTGTTTGTDIIEAVNTVLAGLNLTTEKLQCIASDGAPSMTGKRRGALTLLENSMKDDGHNHEILKVHCIIHQEALCAKHVTMKEVKQTVVKTVNFIRSRALNHRQFQQLLHEMDSEYGDLLYFSEVRWLSREATLERFYQVRSEIDIFLREKDFAHCEISNPEWISNFALMVDILQLQGRSQQINVLYERICAFEIKLCLWEAQLKSRNFTHFPHLMEN